MKVLLFAALLAVAAAMVAKDDNIDNIIGKDNLATKDVKTKQLIIMKLLNHILQPTLYQDIRDAAKEWELEANVDKYLKSEVVKDFLAMYKYGMLPRGENFVHSSELHIKEAVKVFRLLYFAKDFDVFIRTASWLRERINPGMFVYALTAAVFHREDTRGIVLPAPYEIYPYYFVNSDVIQKAYMMKMTKGVADPALLDYYGIKVTDKNQVIIDSRSGVRHVLSEDDRVAYFTEDIDLNTYFYYLHLNYPYWMTDDTYSINKERRGEIQMYAAKQLLARLRLERLGHEMCDIRTSLWDKPMETGYWPKIRLHTGDEMPVRQINQNLVNDLNLKYKKVLDSFDWIIENAILTGKLERRDGTEISLKKPEDIENLSRLLVGGLGIKDDAKVIHISSLIKKVLSYNTYNTEKHTYIPTALDLYTTCLRDPLFWKVLKRITYKADLFKSLLRKYTNEELDFPGVKVESITTDKLVTFMDEYDIDITNAVYLDQTEIQKKRSDMVLVARQRRLNHQPFKVTIEVESDKAVDAVVRVFLGPKYDCMGRLMSINDKRLDMLEIDTFLYKLQTGKNTIVRDSLEMHENIQDRPLTRRLLDQTVDSIGSGDRIVENWWYKSRLGFPHRLTLPLGKLGGLPLQLYVIVSPVRTGNLLSSIDINISKERHTCRYSTCIDTMPLGFPFDREIEESKFFKQNMKVTDVMVYRKDLEMSNLSKDVDMSRMVMKRDDLTYLDNDMLVRKPYRDVMMDTDHTKRM